MTNPATDLHVNSSKTPKRLYILDDEEIEALYARPHFTEDDRTLAFMLTPSEKDLIASFSPIHIQLYFILQLGYFKAKQLFFTFTFHDVVDDMAHLLQRYFPDVPLGPHRPQPKLPPKSKCISRGW